MGYIVLRISLSSDDETAITESWIFNEAQEAMTHVFDVYMKSNSYWLGDDPESSQKDDDDDSCLIGDDPESTNNEISYLLGDDSEGSQEIISALKTIVKDTNDENIAAKIKEFHNYTKDLISEPFEILDILSTITNRTKT